MILDIRDLYVTEALQRDMRLSVINKIIKNYNPKAIGIIVVSHRNGVYYIIDGQHRVYALKEMGIFEAECRVFEGLTSVDEAILYQQLATSSAHSKYEKYKASLEMGDPLAIGLKALVEGCNLELGGKKGEGVLGCINDLYKCYLMDEKLLSKTLFTFTENFELERGLTGTEVMGMFMFLREALKVKGFNYTMFQERLKSETQNQIARRGSANREVSYTNRAKGYALALVTLYNYRKSDKNRIALDLIV